MNISTGSRFHTFVRDVESALEDHGNREEALLSSVGYSMRRLVSTDDWLPDAYARPHPQYYQQYLLHADPEGRFSVVSFVWGPGQFTPIHDHQVWGVIGVLRGGEFVEHYDLKDIHHVNQRGEIGHLKPGDVGFVSPTIGDVHRVRNAFDDKVSISIHAYGGNIGTISRFVYSQSGEARKSFVSGYANAHELTP